MQENEDPIGKVLDILENLPEPLKSLDSNLKKCLREYQHQHQTLMSELSKTQSSQSTLGKDLKNQVENICREIASKANESFVAEATKAGKALRLNLKVLNTAVIIFFWALLPTIVLGGMVLTEKIQLTYFETKTNHAREKLERLEAEIYSRKQYLDRHNILVIQEKEPKTQTLYLPRNAQVAESGTSTVSGQKRIFVTYRQP